MAGKIKAMIDDIIKKRAGENATIINATKTKLILRGINPDKFNATTPDDPATIEKLKTIAQDLGVAL